MIRSHNFVLLLMILILGLSCQCLAFNPVSRVEAKRRCSDEISKKASISDEDVEMINSRRSFLVQAAIVSVAAGSSNLWTNIDPANASGGATAGGAYLLSAKQRYNERVKAGIQGFLALESSLKNGSVTEAQAYFASDEQGSWGDISTAGYLLANAFRRNSSASPDSLPSVKVNYWLLCY